MLPHRKPPPAIDTLQVPSNAAGRADGSWGIPASERAGPLGSSEDFGGAEGDGSAAVAAGSCTSVRTVGPGSGVSAVWLKRTSREPFALCWMCTADRVAWIWLWHSI